MKNAHRFNSVNRTISWILALIFLIAGIGKFSDPATFALLIGSYGLVPESWTKPLAYLLPMAEILAAIGLIMGFKWALHAILALTLLFIAVLIYGIQLGLTVDCGCFGPGDPELKAFSGLHSALVKDLLLLLGIFLLYGLRYRLNQVNQKARF